MPATALSTVGGAGRLPQGSGTADAHERGTMLYTLDDVGLETESEEWWVAPTAVLVGRVRLEHEAAVWWGAVLRGDNELITVGRGSNVQDNCVCHTDPGHPLVIGPNVTVGHMAVLHGCTIGEGTLVGIGAIVLNGAKVG